MNIIDGKAISKQIKDEVKEKVAALKAQGVTVTLAVVQVGNDPASSVYVNNKKKACAYTGMESESFELPEETTQEELLSLIEELNGRKEINGILVQLPLPKHIDEICGDPCDLSEEGCGRLPSAECRCALYRTAGLCIVYTGGDHRAAKEIRY